MKQVWIKADPWDKALVTAALETGADAVIVSSDRIEDVRKLGLIKTVSDEGDIRWGRDARYAEVRSAEDEDTIVAMGREGVVIVKTGDWSVIPLENLVARSNTIFVEVDEAVQARTVCGILERGVSGLVVSHRDPAAVREIVGAIRAGQNTITLSEFAIDAVRPVGMGDRVCVDTCCIMEKGQGALAGNSVGGFFLVHAESLDNPYVAPRPFRINAGAVHAYILTAGGRTRYLSELKSGDEIAGVGPEGRLMPLLVGRVKIERRPMLLVEATGPNGPASLICQNAETIRLVRRNGDAVSAFRMKQGDRVLGYAEEGGRHFGYKISETIIEK